MNKNVIPSFNSPIQTTSTPIRRLGLSRKRKKCDSLEKLPQSYDSDLADTPTSSYTKQLSSQNAEVVKKQKIENNKEKTTENDNLDLSEDCNDELAVIKKRTEETEEKLNSLDKRKNKILELENLIEIWKKGCKNAYLYLVEIMKAKNENFDSRKMLESLGVWNTMVEIFEDDPDITLVEN